MTAIAVGRTDDLDEVLDRVLRLVFDWVEADRGCVMLRDAETGNLQMCGIERQADMDKKERREQVVDR